MKLFIIIFSILFCVSCNQPTNNGSLNTQNVSSIQQKNDTVYERDKSHVANAFIANVEALRIAEKNNGQDAKSSPIYKDPANIYLPYAIRYNAESMEYEGSPLPTSEQISVNTDTIVYSSDSLLCVSLITIDNHFTDIPPYESKRVQKGKYDGRALIGCRNNIRDQFKVYPLTMYSVIGLDNPEIVNNLLKKYFFHGIVGKIGPMGSNIEGIEYTCGIGDSEFFEKAPNFIKYNGKYKFEFYKKGNTELPYIYYSNM